MGPLYLVLILADLAEVRENEKVVPNKDDESTDSNEKKDRDKW